MQEVAKWLPSPILSKRHFPAIIKIYAGCAINRAMTLVQALRISQLKPVMNRSDPMEAGREKDWKLRGEKSSFQPYALAPSYSLNLSACLISDLLKAKKWDILITVILHVNSVHGS